VKAICDWADGNKEEDRTAHQQTAATNAAKFVLHSLRFTPFQRPGAPPIEDVETASQSSLPPQQFFFGREKELASIAEAILPESRTWGVLIDYIALLSELAMELGDKDVAKTPENERANAVRRSLTTQRALIVIDNLETFPEAERIRLYQFLNLLPHGCKAIVTSRRRSDVDARVIRVDRMDKKDALDLLGELARTNRHLAKAEPEWQTLYEVTGGIPLPLRWTAGQLASGGR
jgi:hypothetical protein